jgi:hypothetical protein
MQVVRRPGAFIAYSWHSKIDSVDPAAQANFDPDAIRNQDEGRDSSGCKLGPLRDRRRLTG